VSPEACDSCLRRLALVGSLASFIEKVATGEPGSRSPELLALDDEPLARAVAGRKADRLLDEAAAADIAELRERIAAAGCWAVCRHDPAFPGGLQDARDAPPALIGCGAAERLERLEPAATVTVVGARRASSYGREVAKSLGRELAAAGFAVVSGMAWGVDGAAHTGAVETGLTVAVLGCGADVPYPRHHGRMHGQIAERGLVLSELPPGTTPWHWTFPARNRIMAGLAAMTIVVEAAKHSGSLITADLASDLGRLVGAVPGPVGVRTAEGTNQLLVDGASPVRGAEDVLDALIGPGAGRMRKAGPPIEPGLAAVLDRVERGERAPDAIALGLGRGASEVAVSLVRLEGFGYLECSLSGNYSRTSLCRPDDAGG
jgi:DNA processing protein